MNLRKKWCLIAVASAFTCLSMTGGIAIAQTSDSNKANEIVLPTKTISGRDFPVYYRQALPVDAPRVRYPGFKQETVILKAGTVRREGAMPLPCDILLQRDTPITLRDGTVIYADVFRPVKDGKYPAIMAWSPYGKEIGGQMLDDVPGRAGVPLSATSGLERFEGPDPAYWVQHGYAVINPDKRGAYYSEGNINYWGKQDSEDGYDTIEWIAKQPWSNGNVGMSGNSWLTVSQWFIASEQPPHLKAIAPWEGFSDHFHEAGNRGGIPGPEFPEMINETFASKNGLLENQPRMIVDYQLMNDYWDDKRARLDKIKIPAYVVASYTNDVHTHGTFAGFRGIASKDKWLRVHNTQEWFDYYTPENVEDLRKFFDHYLKNVDNDWQQTPRVRLSVLDPGSKDIVNRTENEFPLARTQYHKLYLTENNKLSKTADDKATSVQYDVDGKAPQADFYYTFDKDTELTGYMNLHLWVEASGSDDMELAVNVEKVDADKQPIPDKFTHNPIVATGQLRVSQRALDKEKSTPSEPYLKNTAEEKLQPGEIVPVDIGIWPMGMIYHKGESLHLTVKAYEPPKVHIPFGEAKITIAKDQFTFDPKNPPEMMTIGGNSDQCANKNEVVTSPPTRNKGVHIIHMGGKYDSYLYVPEISDKSKTE